MSVDAHFHIDSERFLGTIDSVINEAKDGGLRYLLASADSYESSKIVVKLCPKYNELYCTVGIHPLEASNDIKNAKKIEQFLKTEKVIGIGEIGLDFHYDISSKEDQYTVFIEQLALAEKYSLPVVIHARDAEEEALAEVNKFNLEKVFFHCFSGSVATAKKIISKNYKIGITGIVTFKKNENIVDIIKICGLDNIFTETDAPYLAPVPHRGKLNVPKYIPLIEEKIASIMGNNISSLDVSNKMEDNFKSFFSIH